MSTLVAEREGVETEEVDVEVNTNLARLPVI